MGGNPLRRIHGTLDTTHARARRRQRISTRHRAAEVLKCRREAHINPNASHDGIFYFHGVLVENSAPGVVLYNISTAACRAHDFILRQPGWEKNSGGTMNPAYNAPSFLSKPESGGSGSPSPNQPGTWIRAADATC